MNKIKDCISAIVDIFNENFNMNLTAECIRLAKFDRRESVSTR